MLASLDGLAHLKWQDGNCQDLLLFSVGAFKEDCMDNPLIFYAGRLL
jgi:hypothetical protein